MTTSHTSPGDRARTARGWHAYRVYGVGIRSDGPLALPHYSHDPLGEVSCAQVAEPIFAAALADAVVDTQTDPWTRRAVTRDGSAYVGWDAIGEFLVSSNGERILCRRASGCSDESFQVYLLGHALSVALVRQWFEPLHATAVAIDGRAVAFLGSHAFGKSTLAACFLASDDRLLTDDLLVLRQTGAGVYAYPGTPRIKLFPGVARRLLPEIAAGVEMNADTSKLILPLGQQRVCGDAIPLAAIYCLGAPDAAPGRGDSRIDLMPLRDACIGLVASAFNRTLNGRERVRRQFTFVTELAAAIPVRKLIYPRNFRRLPEVRECILADLEGDPH